MDASIFNTPIKHQDLKFSHIHPSTLGVLSNRDIQIFRLESGQLRLHEIADIGQITTFEWQRCASKSQMHQFVLAAHPNGRISLFQSQIKNRNYKCNEPHLQSGQDVRLVKVEKVFVTSSMVQNQRHCMALAWNPVNPRLFAAGYDHCRNESSLLIWDIEQNMNDYLKRIRQEEQQQASGTGPWPQADGKNIHIEGHRASMGQVEMAESPLIITDQFQSFQNITDDIYSIAWLPESEHELIFATENQI